MGKTFEIRAGYVINTNSNSGAIHFKSKGNTLFNFRQDLGIPWYPIEGTISTGYQMEPIVILPHLVCGTINKQAGFSRSGRKAVTKVQ